MLLRKNSTVAILLLTTPATPLDNAHPGGFLLPMNNQNNTFEKPPISINAQIELLKSRDLIIQDIKMAQHYLTFIRASVIVSPIVLNLDSENHYYSVRFVVEGV